MKVERVTNGYNVSELGEVDDFYLHDGDVAELVSALSSGRADNIRLTAERDALRAALTACNGTMQILTPYLSEPWKSDVLALRDQARAALAKAGA